jgi:uncharacterized membrane protein
MLSEADSTECKMQKVGIVLIIIFGVLLLLGGIGLLGVGGFGMDSEMMGGSGAIISPPYLALLISAGVLIVVLLAHGPSHAALDIAKTRFAKGKINQKQFSRIKHDLRR